MVDTKALLRASLEVSKDFLKAPAQPGGGDNTDHPPEVRVKQAPLIVPIRSLDEAHRERIAQHLLALDGSDRYLRFGYSATDEHVRRYVEGLNFERDEIFGVFSRKLELVAMAHLAYIGKEAGEGCKSCAEFGVSVLKESRSLGLGAALFDRAAMHARNDGIELMFIHALSENNVMLKIARNASAKVEQIGSESEAYLRLMPATLDSRFTELVEEQVAQMDYRLKVQAKQFWDFWANLQQHTRLH